MAHEIGWASIKRVNGEWEAVTEAENRRVIAEMDAADYDQGATHVGYWNGVTWEDVEPLG